MNHPLYEKIMACKPRIAKFTDDVSFFDSLEARQKLIEIYINQIAHIFESNGLDLSGFDTIMDCIPELEKLTDDSNFVESLYEHVAERDLFLDKIVDMQQVIEGMKDVELDDYFSFAVFMCCLDWILQYDLSMLPSPQKEKYRHQIKQLHKLFNNMNERKISLESVEIKYNNLPPDAGLVGKWSGQYISSPAQYLVLDSEHLLTHLFHFIDLSLINSIQSVTGNKSMPRKRKVYKARFFAPYVKNYLIEVEEKERIMAEQYSALILYRINLMPLGYKRGQLNPLERENLFGNFRKYLAHSVE